MHLVEQHRIDGHDPRWTAIDEAAFASKNLYNVVQYLKRQAFIHEHKILTLGEIYHAVKDTPEYRALPAKVSNQVLQQEWGRIGVRVTLRTVDGNTLFSPGGPYFVRAMAGVMTVNGPPMIFRAGLPVVVPVSMPVPTCLLGGSESIPSRWTALMAPLGPGTNCAYLPKLISVPLWPALGNRSPEFRFFWQPGAAAAGLIQ